MRKIFKSGLLMACMAFLLAILVVASCGKSKKKSFGDYADDLSTEMSIASAYGEESSLELGEEVSASDETQEENEDKEKQGNITLTCKSTKVSGDLSSCFEVIDGTYNFEHDLMTDYINVKIKRTNGSLPLRSGEKLGKAYSGTGNIMALDWSMHVYDESGKEVAIMGNYEDSEVMNKFADSSSGTVKEVSFVPSLSDEDTFKKLKKGKFTIECVAKHFVDGHYQFE